MVEEAMGSRISRIGEREALKGYRSSPVGAGSVGELRLKESITTDAGKTYKGQAAFMEMAFTGTPGLTGPIKSIILNVPNYKDRVLRLDLWQDTDPLFDKYRIRLWLAGDYDIPEGGTSGAGAPKIVPGGVGALPVLFIPAIIVALGVLALFGAVVWKVTKVSWGKAVAGISTLMIAAGVVLVGSLYVMSRPSSPTPARQRRRA
jgi:hypothetical protein